MLFKQENINIFNFIIISYFFLYKSINAQNIFGLIVYMSFHNKASQQIKPVPDVSAIARTKDSVTGIADQKLDYIKIDCCKCACLLYLKTPRYPFDVN